MGADRRYVTLDDPHLRIMANEDPQLFLAHYPSPVLIDEIQYAPGLLPYIKILVDQTHRPGGFWLTGSQPFHLMKNITESLAGRVAILNLLGFSGREARQEPPRPMPISPDSLAGSVPLSGSSICLDPDDLYRRIWMGGFPALLSGAVQDREVFFSSYFQTYLLRDVSDLAQIGDRAAFLMFLKACAARTGQMLNLSELARDTQVSVNTAKHWLSIL